jgi:hypothetical protein
MVALLERCKAGLKPGGFIWIKENICKQVRAQLWKLAHPVEVRRWRMVHRPQMLSMPHCTGVHRSSGPGLPAACR